MKPRPKAKSPPGKLGFSLIELLVSVATVAVLASVVIVAVGHMRERSMRTQGASDLRQMGAAFNLYLADNNGDGPPGSVNPHFWRANGRFVNMGSMLPYLGISNTPRISTPELLLSPGSVERQYDRYKAMAPDNPSGACTYYMNLELAGARVSGGVFPSTRVVFHDSGYWWDGTYNGVDNWDGEGMFVVRLDGSVAWIEREETSGMIAWDYSQLDRIK